MKHYEGMFLLHNRDPGGSEEEPAPTQEEVVKQLLDKIGAELSYSAVWANRKLSYPVNGNQTGTYVLTYFSAPADSLTELDRHVGLSDRVLRHMLVALDALPTTDEIPGPLADSGRTAGRRFEGDTVEVKTAEGDEEQKKVWELLDYKNPQVLRRMISAQGKLFSRVRSNLHAKSQRRLRRAVHRARNMALLPFVGR